MTPEEYEAAKRRVEGEVGTFGEREAEIARQAGVLEVGLVVRPWRQQDDVRRAAAARGMFEHRFLQRAEERGEQLHC